jgi:NTP pyrophosphatase (non-canonical NTP hydrolase)
MKPEYNPNGTLRSTSIHYDAVKAFTVAMGQPVGQEVLSSDLDLLKMRTKLIEEETKEVVQETLWEDAYGNPKINKAELTKELADLLYVTYGMAVTFGLPIDEVFERVHRSNMSKLGDDGKPLYRDDGKVLKGPNYQPPKLDDLFDVSV